MEAMEMMVTKVTMTVTKTGGNGKAKDLVTPTGGQVPGLPIKAHGMRGLVRTLVAGATVLLGIGVKRIPVLSVRMEVVVVALARGCLLSGLPPVRLRDPLPC